MDIEQNHCRGFFSLRLDFFLDDLDDCASIDEDGVQRWDSLTEGASCGTDFDLSRLPEGSGVDEMPS